MATDKAQKLSVKRITATLIPSLAFIIVLHSSIMHQRPDILDSENRVRDTKVNDMYESYDFVIVGGGSAGSVLANRLSEVPHWNILLLEAGPDELALSDLPMLFPVLQITPINWKYKTEPNDNYCLAMKGRRCNWPRGKVLGGSSVLNAMLYVRGNRKDYDRWEELGNPGWGYDSVLPYFKKSENMRIEEFRNDPFHGTQGFLTVELFRFHSAIVEWFLQAGEQLGYQIRDINGETQTGFTLSHGTLRDGLRCSTAKAYLRPIHDRENLHISLLTEVENILINEETKQAYGVDFNKVGVKRTVYAHREVILSAGSIQSPQLLMLSGVGPAIHLQDVGIDVVVDSPGVGSNLQDHVSVGGVTYLFDPPPRCSEKCTFSLPEVYSPDNIEDFAENERGPMYWLPVCEVMGFVNTKYANRSEDWPDIQIFFAGYSDNSDGGLFSKPAAGLTDDFYTSVFEEIIYEQTFSLMPLVMRPRSRGRILLKDSHHKTHPLIFPNYYSDPYDIQVMVS